MARRLSPASLYADARRRTVVVPLPLLPLASPARALGLDWEARPELHVTAVAADHLRSPLDPAATWSHVLAAIDGRRAGPVRLGEELRIACVPGERSLVLMAHVDGLRDVWLDIAGRLGIPAPAPPTHITLCTRPGGAAIGIHDETMLRERTRSLSAREAAEARAALGLDGLLG